MSMSARDVTPMAESLDDWARVEDAAGNNSTGEGLRCAAQALRSYASLLSSVEDGEGIVRELRDCENACRINGLNVTADIYGNAAARIMLDAQEKAALQGKIARLKEVAHNNAERSNANYVAMQSALEFIDLTIERREAFAEYRAAPPKE